MLLKQDLRLVQGFSEIGTLYVSGALYVSAGDGVYAQVAIYHGVEKLALNTRRALSIRTPPPGRGVPCSEIKAYEAKVTMR